jgi:hypothetical protein
LDLHLEKVKEALDIIEQHKVPFMLAFNQRFDPHFNPHCAERPNLGLKKNIFVKFQTILG